MSGYSRRRVAGSSVTEPAVPKQRKASELQKGERHGEKKCDVEGQTCDVGNIKLSHVCSLSQSSYYYNSSMASKFDGSQHVPVVETSARPNDYKLLSEFDVEYKSLDDDTVSISSNESNCDIRKVATRISENVSTKPAPLCSTKGKDKNRHKFLSSDLTEEGGVSNEPKLSVSPKVSSLMSKLKNSKICVENTAKVGFIENTEHADGAQLKLSEAALLPSSKTRKVLDVAQILSTLSSPQSNAGENVIQSKQNKLPSNKTRSTAYPEQTGIETLTRNSDVQRKSSSSVSPDNQSKHGDKFSSKEFCCVFSWSAYINAKHLQCPCTFAVGTTKPGWGYIAGSSSPVSQVPPELESCKDDVSLIKDLNNCTYTVQKGITSMPQVNTQGQLGPETNDSTEEHTQNKLKTQANTLRRRSRTGRRSQASALYKRENSHSKEKQKSITNSLLGSKTRNKSRANLLDSQEKAQQSDIQLYKVKEAVKTRFMDSDIISISSNESDSDMMVAEVSVPKNVRKGLPEQSIFQELTLSSPMSRQENGKNCNDANISKADQNKNILNADLTCHLKTTGAVPSVQTRKVLEVAQGHRSLTSLKNNSEENSIQSEQNQLARNEGRRSEEVRSEMFSEVLNEYSFTSGTEEIPQQSSTSLEINAGQHSQSLPLGDQEYQFGWTDQLSEIKPDFPLGMHTRHMDMSSEDKETAVKNEQEAIDTSLDNLEDLLKQFDEEYENLFCNNRGNNGLHSAMPSDDLSNDKTAEKIKNHTSSKTFCCMLSWSAHLCGEQSKCLCTCVSDTTNKPTGEKTQYTQPARPGPESTDETIETLASPKMDVKKSNIGNKRGRDKKVCSQHVDNSQLYLQNVKQSPSTQLCKNLLVEKNRKENCVSPKKTITSTLSDSGLNLWSKTDISGLFKDGSTSCKSDNSGSSSSKHDFKVPGQMSKDVQPMHPEDKYNLPNDMTRPKKQKRSFVPVHRSTGVHPAKSNCSLEPEILGQTISSEKALNKFSSPLADKKDPLICNRNKSGSEMSAQDIHHLKVYIQEVKGNQLMKSWQNTQVSTKKSVTTSDTQKSFPDLQTKTDFQLRKFDPEQELSKDNYTLVNKVTKNTYSVVKQNRTDLHLLPAIQNSTQETHQEIVPKDKHDSTARSKDQTQNQNLCISTEGIETRYLSRRRSHNPGLDKQNISFVETTEAPPPSVGGLKSSIIWDKSKVRSEHNKQNKDNVKSPIEKRLDRVVCFQDSFVYKGISHIPPLKTLSGIPHLDLQTKTFSPTGLLDSQLVLKFDNCVDKTGNAGTIPAMQETRCSKKHEGCGKKLEDVGHKGKKQTPGQRKRKANNSRSKKRSSKRRKLELSNQNAPSAEKKPTGTKEISLLLEQTAGCLLTHTGGATVSSKGGATVSSKGGATVSSKGGATVSSKGGATVSSKGGATVSSKGGATVSSKGGATVSSKGGATVSSKGGATVVNEVTESCISDQVIICIDRPPNKQSQKLSNLEKKHNLDDDSKKLSPTKQGVEAEVLRDKLTTCLQGNKNPNKPGLETETLVSLLPALRNVAVCQSNNAGVQQTKSTDNLLSYLEKVAPPTSDTEVKTLDSLHCGRLTGQSTPEEKIHVKQCVLRLCRLPLPLERPFLLDNMSKTGKNSKVEGKADAGK